MTRNYYDGWQTADAKCGKCDWTGKLADADQELFSELMQLNCPKCDGRLDLVMFPTIEEGIAAGPNVSAEEREYIAEIARGRMEFEALKLKTPDQLPDIDDATIVLTWDWVGVEGDSRTEIRHGSRIIWREPAVYEGYERFEEVVDILRQRYGERLYDVVPTRASQLYLLGDSFSASGRIDAIRGSLRGEPT